MTPLTRKLLEVQDTSVSQALDQLVRDDQSMRNKYKQYLAKFPGWEEAAAAWVRDTGCPQDDLFGDRSRQRKLVNVLAKTNALEKSDWKKVWLIAQHCDFDRTFQQKILVGIKDHLGVNSDEFKYLSDRISCGCYGTQKYGTQDHCDKD